MLLLEEPSADIIAVFIACYVPARAAVATT
jgi:hypothetical protein